MIDEPARRGIVIVRRWRWMNEGSTLRSGYKGGEEESERGRGKADGRRKEGRRSQASHPPVASSRRARILSPRAVPEGSAGDRGDPTLAGDGRRRGELPARRGAPRLRGRAVRQVLHHLV